MVNGLSIHPSTYTYQFFFINILFEIVHRVNFTSPIDGLEVGDLDLNQFIFLANKLDQFWQFFCVAIFWSVPSWASGMWWGTRHLSMFVGHQILAFDLLTHDLSNGDLRLSKRYIDFKIYPRATWLSKNCVWPYSCYTNLASWLGFSIWWSRKPQSKTKPSSSSDDHSTCMSSLLIKWLNEIIFFGLHWRRSLRTFKCIHFFL